MNDRNAFEFLQRVLNSLPIDVEEKSSGDGNLRGMIEMLRSENILKICDYDNFCKLPR
jgi:hypothetical protein